MPYVIEGDATTVSHSETASVFPQERRCSLPYMWGYLQAPIRPVGSGRCEA
jgi:hypothetical protein